MKLGIAADHGGYDLKEQIKKHVEAKGIEIIDYGTHSLESVDYPDYAYKLTTAVLGKEVDLGIAICGTGVGISIACNKVEGIRAAHCTDSFTARATRQHNDANIICLGGRITGIEIAKDIIDNFLESSFDGGRHQNRINKITAIEKGEYNV
ncbi:ribose 5-phosphate isomerase B [Microaceticoccus formicicus]|uniref:ribose 5-phosphate isomerase B n=1 Tax=Microaceticoccus formicicus TaxID=3118105 RepID=UPI003CD00D7A|nr:ribose 5-phosphate isomerase B [Peptoniphilaceae bacterium AMB_02]